jgi:hypothetical protein
MQMQFSLALSFPVMTLQAIAVEASVATTSFRTDFDHGNGVGSSSTVMSFA